MSGINFFRTSIIFVGPFLLTACNSPDFGNVSPDFSPIKKVSASILNIGKTFNDPKNENNAGATLDTPLPLKDILEGSLATKNRGTDF